MTKQTIKVEGLPEGWSAKEFRLGEINEPYYDPATKSICRLFLTSTVGVLIVEKIQPRRIVLEETCEDDCGMETIQNFNIGNTIINVKSQKIWREVKETDAPLLSLSVDECKDLQVISDVILSRKIQDFIRAHKHD